MTESTSTPINKWKEGTFTQDDMRAKYNKNAKSETWNRSTRFALEHAEKRVNIELCKAMQLMDIDDINLHSGDLFSEDFTYLLSEHNQEDSCDSEAESLDFSDWGAVVDGEKVMELVAVRLRERGFQASTKPGWVTIRNTWWSDDTNQTTFGLTK